MSTNVGKYFDSERGEWVVPKLTEFQRNELHRTYYDEGLTRGRDTLYYHFIERSIDEDNPNLLMSKRRIMEWLRRQELWQLSQRPHLDKPIRALLAGRPGAVFQVDLMDFSKKPDGRMKFVMVMVDAFTRFAWTMPLRSKDDRFMVEAIGKLWPLVEADYPTGVFRPRIISSDNGPEFTGGFMRFFLEMNRGRDPTDHLQFILGVPGRPESQGLVERANQSIKYLLLRTARRGEAGWVGRLEAATRNYNGARNRNLGMSPRRAMGLDAGGVAALARRLKDLAVEKRTLRRPPLVVGKDVVRVKRNKSALAKSATDNWGEELWVVVGRTERWYRDSRGRATANHPVSIYVVVQVSDGEIDDAFNHQSAPPSASDPGRVVMRGMPWERLLKIGE